MIGEATWGDRLRLRIAGAGLTQAQAAAKLKLTRARISELCTRDTAPRVTTVIRLAEALGCEPSDLDPRLAGGEILPEANSRIHKAGSILEQQFGLEVEYVQAPSGHYIMARKPGDSFPYALVSGTMKDKDPEDSFWGCLASAKVQAKILAALTGHA